MRAEKVVVCLTNRTYSAINTKNIACRRSYVSACMFAGKAVAGRGIGKHIAVYMNDIVKVELMWERKKTFKIAMREGGKMTTKTN